jgi:ELWxxDGT repeat protein
MLVADLNRTGGRGFSPQPDSLVAAGSNLFFVQDDGDHGRELWRSDGTTSGTVLVRDVRAGVESSVAAGSGLLVAAGGHVYFVADDGEHGTELWASDGSEAGTRLVADLAPGAAGTTLQNLTAAGARVFFVTHAGNGQFDLWVSDGTAAGTVAVHRFDSEVVAGLPIFPFRALAGIGSSLFVELRAPGERMQLWKSDGTAPGTTLVKDFGAGTQFWPFLGNDGWVPSLGGTFLFAIDDGVHGVELWRSDGSEAGTALVKDITPGATPSFLASPALFQGQVYFSARMELWRTDGTEAGTTLVVDLGPFVSEYAYRLTVAGTALYFRFPSAGGCLWTSDGTGPGTRPISALCPGGRADLRGQLAFTAEQSLWITDGTESGTFRVAGPLSSIGESLVGSGGLVYFPADDGTEGLELWRSDGTSSGTSMPRPLGAQDPVGSSRPRRLTAIGDQLWFAADDGQRGVEAWMALPGDQPYDHEVNPGPAGSEPADFLPFAYAGGGMGVLLAAYEPTSGREVRVQYPGLSGGVQLLHDVRPGAGSSNPRMLTSLGTRFLFLADDGVHGEELFVSGGGFGTHALVKDARPGPGSSTTSADRLVVVGSAAHFVADDGEHGLELWRSDGTEAGTRMVEDIFPGPTGSSPGDLVSFGGRLHFAASDAGGRGLWATDGTEAGTLLVKDFGTEGSGPQALTPVGAWLFFVSRDGTGAWTLWKSNGTAAGTTPVTDLLSAGTPGELTALDGVLLLTLDDGVHGRELWRSDGTAAGTRLVKDVRPGADSSSPGPFTSFAGVVHFAADDGASGRELWRSDGTEAGTVLVADVNPGPVGSSPAGLTATATQLYFAADDGVHGEELWRVVLSQLLDCQPRSLSFGWTGGIVTSPQPFRILTTDPQLSWSARPDAPFVHVAPESGQGSATVTVTFDPALVPAGWTAATANVVVAGVGGAGLAEPRTVSVSARAAGRSAPFGVVDTPTSGAAGVTGAIPVTGWALDDIEVTKVEVHRDPRSGEPTRPNGKVYVGDGTFVPGARPDVDSLYRGQGFPLTHRAGWGYMLLTNMLPGQGNGPFTLYAYAYDGEAHVTLLGSKAIACANAMATKPFGTIDTPGQGETISGTSYRVYGWALTPLPAAISTDGSTIQVYVDDAPLGHPVYNQYRVDIATLFPGYANSDGAVGYYDLDTTTLTNGMHTIAWSVTDDQGRADGIGSRYFWVQN